MDRRDDRTLPRLCLLALPVLAALAPLPAFAHESQAVAPADLWHAWQPDPSVLVGALLVGWLYARGAAAIRRHAGGQRALPGWRLFCFWAGLATLALALASPLDTLAGTLFSAHMAQHLLLMAVVPPLMLLGLPLLVVLDGLPRPWRRWLVDRWGARAWPGTLWFFLTGPVVAWLLNAAGTWVWHQPALYQAAVRHEGIHIGEHLTFLVTSFLFWWCIIQPVGRRRLDHGLAVLSLFAMGMQGAMLGALLTFWPQPWYPLYIGRTTLWGLSALSDQRLAGLMMWIPAGSVYMLAGLVLIGQWLKDDDGAVVAPATARAGPAPFPVSGGSGTDRHP